MDAFIVNCKPNNWEICNKYTIFGLKDSNAPPLSKGDLILFRISGPNYGLKALWYYEYAKKVVNQKNIHLSDDDYAWILNCKKILTLTHRFSEEFQTSSKKSSKITDLYAGGIQRAIVAIKKPQLRDYIFHILKEYENELGVNINYLGEDVNANELLQNILDQIVAVAPFPESEENETILERKEKADKQISEQKEKPDKSVPIQKNEPGKPVSERVEKSDKQISKEKEKSDELIPEQKNEPVKPILVQEEKSIKQISGKKEKLDKPVSDQKDGPDKPILVHEEKSEKQISKEKGKSDELIPEQKDGPDEPILVQEEKSEKQISKEKGKSDELIPEQKDEPDEPILVHEEKSDKQISDHKEKSNQREIELEEMVDESILEHQEELDESILELDEDFDESENKVPTKISKQQLYEQVGERINLPVLNYAPLNEKGVILLFGHYMQRLGISHVEEIKEGFPDAIAIRSIENGKYQRVRIGFEFKSSSFLKKGHKINECDLIVCWKHDWNNCPIEVIELSNVLFNKIIS